MALPVYPTAPQLFLLRIKCFGQGMQVLAGVIKVQQLVGLWPALFDQAPDPRCTIADSQALLRAPQTVAQGFPVKTLSQSHCFALPTHAHFFGQLAPGVVFLSIEPPHLLLVPFYTGLLGVSLTPIRPAMAHLKTVYHDHTQRAGPTLRLGFPRHFLESLFRLLLRASTQTLNQRTHR